MQSEIIRILKLQELYPVHNQKCNCGGCGYLNLSEFSNSFQRIPIPVLRAFTQKIRAGGIDSGFVEPVMYREYYRRLVQFTETGVGIKFDQVRDVDLWRQIESYKRELSHFSAAKVNALQSELKGLRKLPLKLYDNEAMKVMHRYSDQYLRTESITALLSAESAEKWRNTQQLKGLYPNVRYVTAGDDLVRPSHRVLDGVIRPLNDPFWRTHWPPNGWRCRCNVVATDEHVTGDKEILPPEKGFDHNPGITGQLIKPDHPYFDMPQRTKNNVFKTAETYRAEYELSTISRIAEKLVGKSVTRPDHDRPVRIEKTGLQRALSSKHSNEAVKNSLLVLLINWLVEARFAKLGEKAVYYRLDELGLTFFIELLEADGAFLFNDIIAEL